MSFDQKDTSFHVRVGYAFNPMFALEAAYYEFGDTRSEVVAEVLDPQAFVEAMADAFPSNVHGPALVARLSWPFAERWAVHLRGGVISWQSDIDAEIISGGSGQFKASRDGEDLIWGVALAWQPSERFAVSLEFTQAQISDDVRTLELGVTWMTGWLSR
jgi:OOP family OmpA-OmpF porin